MKDLYSELIREVLRESYEEGKVYGYHVTYEGALDSIFKNGFNVGQRSMQGKGFYSFYDLKTAIGYGLKDASVGTFIVKFEITDTQKLLYLNMKIAKEILGSQYTLKDQLNKLYKDDGGFYFFYKRKLSYGYDKKPIEEIESMLKGFEENNSEMNQRSFWGNLISSNTTNELNIVLDGNYGVEIRLTDTELAKPLQYMTATVDGKDSGWLDFK